MRARSHVAQLPEPWCGNGICAVRRGRGCGWVSQDYGLVHARVRLVCKRSGPCAFVRRQSF
eukprot:1298397-Lingulodinium_polyedra.AAC.1